MSAITTVLFDAYGTLFDLRSALRERDLGASADLILASWRQKQLEYSWTSTLQGRYAGFDVLTKHALRYALAAAGREGYDLEDALWDAFRRLSPYPDARTAVEALRGRGLSTGILSNGTEEMLQGLLQANHCTDLFSPVLSVDSVRRYKPDPKVYALATETLRLRPDQIGFVSSNAWDAAGATAFGFRVFWVNRSSQPVEYELAKRATIVASLGELESCIGA
jgi:2-haloacid dehalogenase